MPRKTAYITAIVVAATLTPACGSSGANTSTTTARSLSSGASSSVSSVATQIRQALNTIIPKESDIKAITDANGTVTVATKLPEGSVPTTIATSACSAIKAVGINGITHIKITAQNGSSLATC